MCQHCPNTTLGPLLTQCPNTTSGLGVDTAGMEKCANTVSTLKRKPCVQATAVVLRLARILSDLYCTRGEGGKKVIIHVVATSVNAPRYR